MNLYEFVALFFGQMVQARTYLPENFFSLGPAMPYLTLLMDISGVNHPQGKRHAVIFYLFGHPTPYDYGNF
jgi:hypothetical protein